MEGTSPLKFIMFQVARKITSFLNAKVTMPLHNIVPVCHRQGKHSYY